MRDVRGRKRLRQLIDRMEDEGDERLEDSRQGGKKSKFDSG